MRMRLELKSDRAFILGLSLLTAIGLVAFGYWHQRERLDFERSLHVGMSRAEVLAAVGSPQETIAPGRELRKWGSAAARIVTNETWVYYVVPRSQHRFVLTFAEDELVHMEHGGN